ncbi:MAG TPA: C40 family peptidase [Pyrinomonadaceae bacterium]|nr:C40 family peptidase [Pyrinomonadaceae bacterium]
MVLRKPFARVLVGCLALSLWFTSAVAQTRPRVATGNAETPEMSCSPEDFALMAEPVADAKPAWEAKPRPTIDLTPAIGSSSTNFLHLQPALMAAIDQRLGARYRWGAEGPDRFDCSGFVWSIFNATGITFERGSARTLFARFAAPTPGEEYKFGTLVFFSGLAHVGVVADEHGFYHASRRHGVIYSPFNEYWLKRIDGFRRVPLPATVTD